MREEYKKLKDFSNYRIYSNGKIYSEFINKFIRDFDGNHGYRQVTLRNNLGKRMTIKVHILVAKAWLLNPNKYTEINHKDKCKSNNNVENLEWCDRKYNVSFSSLENKISKQKYLSPLSEDMVRLIPILLNYKFSIKLISTLYKVSHITIRNIISRKTWNNLDLKFPEKTYYNVGLYKKGIVYIPDNIYNLLKSFNIDNTVLNSRIKVLESV